MAQCPPSPTPWPIEEIEPDTLRESVEALLALAFRLCRLVLPAMEARRRGSIVPVNSARPGQPEPGFAVATSG